MKNRDRFIIDEQLQILNADIVSRTGLEEEIVSNIGNISTAN